MGLQQHMTAYCNGWKEQDMIAKQALTLVTSILARYPSCRADEAVLTAWTEELMEFDYDEARKYALALFPFPRS